MEANERRLFGLMGMFYAGNNIGQMMEMQKTVEESRQKEKEM